MSPKSSLAYLVPPVVLIVACGIVACRDLPEIRQGACGNGVVDSGEDCDRFAPEGQQCGPAGTPVACRFVCSQAPDEDAALCPSGWQCGTDDICRAAGGVFSPAGEPIEAAVERVLLGDFQGNGRASVLGLGASDSAGASYARLFFLQDNGSSLESSLLGFPVASPVLGDLSGDGRDDFVFSVISGLGVLLGQPTQELAPVTYPITTLQQGSTTLAIPIRPQPKSVLDEALVILVANAGNGALEALEEGTKIADLPFPHEQLAGEPVVADVIRDMSAPCGEMVLAYGGEPDAWLVQPCKADGSWADPSTSLRLAATLPAGFTVETGPFVDDMDRDGELDLVVGTFTQPFISFGCGNGKFCADKEDPSTAGGMLPIETGFAPVCSGLSGSTTNPLIAIGDLNSDGQPDVVTQSNVLIVYEVDVTPELVRVGQCPVASKLVGGWTTAKIADLNEDGLDDLIAGSSNGLDLDFYAGTGLDRLNLTRITTPAPVSHMAVGDFDGDQVRDVAVGLLGAVSAPEGNQDALAIAYGRVQKPPEPLVTIAGFDKIIEVVAAHFDDVDAVQELGVVALTAENTQAVTVFISSGGRQLLAPFGLIGAPVGPGPTAEVEGYPLKLVLGDFDDDGHEDIASLAISQCSKLPCPLRLWVTPSRGDAELLPSVYGPELPSEILAFAVSEALGLEVAVFLRAVDLDGDPLDDLLLLAPWGTEPNETAAWRAQLDVTADGISLGAVQLISQGPMPLFGGSHPVVEDLDGDGLLDVLALTSGPMGRQVMVAWGNGGGLDLSQPEILELEVEPLGFALVQADTDDMRELIVVSRDHISLLQRGPSEPRIWESAETVDFVGGTSVAARDIDGDGIDDLAVADAAGVRIYRGKAAVR